MKITRLSKNVLRIGQKVKALLCHYPYAHGPHGRALLVHVTGDNTKGQSVGWEWELWQWRLRGFRG